MTTKTKTKTKQQIFCENFQLNAIQIIVCYWSWRMKNGKENSHKLNNISMNMRCGMHPFEDWLFTLLLLVSSTGKWTAMQLWIRSVTAKAINNRNNKITRTQHKRIIEFYCFDSSMFLYIVRLDCGKRKGSFYVNRFDFFTWLFWFLFFHMEFRSTAFFFSFLFVPHRSSFENQFVEL